MFAGWGGNGFDDDPAFASVETNISLVDVKTCQAMEDAFPWPQWFHKILVMDANICAFDFGHPQVGTGIVDREWQGGGCTRQRQRVRVCTAPLLPHSRLVMDVSWRSSAVHASAVGCFFRQNADIDMKESACHGDSGGPLIVFDDKHQVRLLTPTSTSNQTRRAPPPARRSHIAFDSLGITLLMSGGRGGETDFEGRFGAGEA